MECERQQTSRVIAQCSGLADGIAAVNFGRANNLMTAIRGGGHNVGGGALCDDVS